MPSICFLPDQSKIEVDENTKILVAARKAKVDIRFGCASCRCGTCAVRVSTGGGTLKAPKDNEIHLLQEMNLPTDGSIRLSCQARVMSGELEVDLNFQNEYSPDSGISD